MTWVLIFRRECFKAQSNNSLLGLKHMVPKEKKWEFFVRRTTYISTILRRENIVEGEIPKKKKGYP